MTDFIWLKFGFFSRLPVRSCIYIYKWYVNSRGSYYDIVLLNNIFNYSVNLINEGAKDILPVIKVNLTIENQQ